MNTDEILRILARRWQVVVAVAVAAAALGWFSAPGADSRPTNYAATHVLLVDPQRSLLTPESSALNFEQAALLVTIGDVPDRAAERLGFGDPLLLAQTVNAVPDPVTGSLAVTSVNTDPEQAEAVAEAFAEELVAELNEDDVFVYDARLADAQSRTANLQTQIDEQQALLTSLREADEDDAAVRRAEIDLNALTNQFQTAFAEVDALVRAGPPQPALTTLERPHAFPVSRESIRLPDAEPSRAALFLLFGVIAGVAIAVASARSDTRIHDRADAEEAFGVPVLAEIPTIPGLKPGKELLAVTEPGSLYVEPFRSLSTVLLYAAATGLRGSDDDVATAVDREDRQRGHVVLVTSPSASEGKTTTVANLAAVLAETGRRVLVVSADLRRPRVHQLFGVDAEPGIVDVLGDPAGGIGLGDLRLRTDVPNVYLLPSGAPLDNPAPLLRAAVRLISSARGLFDFLIVDCPPVLVANDATELADAADSVVLLAWADRTSRESADRAAEVLRRVGAPLLGSVVVAGSEGPASYRYAYRSAYTGGRTKRDRDETTSSNGVDEERGGAATNGASAEGAAPRTPRARRRRQPRTARQASASEGPAGGSGTVTSTAGAAATAGAELDDDAWFQTAVDLLDPPDEPDITDVAAAVDVVEPVEVAEVAEPSQPIAADEPYEIRPATPEDTPAVLDLLAVCLGRDATDHRFAALHEWKHVENVFGPSPAWVAVAGDEIIGYRAFVRWELHEGVRRWRAVRAVDTATHPHHQRRGVFRALTLQALDALAADDVDFVFNTPNDRSRPGYLAMGWETVGTLTPWGMPSGFSGAFRAATSRVPASHFGVPSDAGLPASEVFADDSVVDALLATLVDDGRLRTVKSPAWLRWRYGSDLHGYRVISVGADPAEGACCVRLRRRGTATEAVIAELFVPVTAHHARRTLLRRALHETGASSLVALGATPRDALVALPRVGPTLVWRALPTGGALPEARWALSMGDVEAF